MQKKLNFRRKKLQTILNTQKGQISVMIAVMMSTFILFFAFVINIGMLVNAKINLQNAADLAAYAGAAVQARQLTQIAYLNYEMRRQYKKYLFRIYVLGNMAERSFPMGGVGGTGPTPMPYKPDGTFDYQVPTTCVIFNAVDNYCQITQLPAISIPPPSFLDAITDTLSGQLTAIEAIRQQNCRAIGITNIMLNMFWLYNTDPYLSNVVGLDQTQSNTLAILQTLATGLGIVPRELLLRQRIKTLNSYVNSTAQMNVKRATVDGLQGKPDPAAFERTIQAFYSAYYTLGNHTFAGDGIIMDELIPTGSSGSNLLHLKEITQRFDTFAIDFLIGSNGTVGGGINTGALTNATSPTGSNCVAVSIPITVGGGSGPPLPVGVYKDPSVLTYYAIRLTATAKVLFSPFGDITMKAYAAAQPFGSRIGPALTEDSFGAISPPPITPGVNSAVGALGSLAGFIPNLPVRLQDSASRENGWDTAEVVSSMYLGLGVGGGGTNLISAESIGRAYQIAMAPNPYEGTRYTIMSDQGADPFVKNFGTDSFGTFWAPIIPPGSQGEGANLQSLVAGFFDSGVQGNLGNTGTTSDLSNLKTATVLGLSNYISGPLAQGSGENNEGTNLVKIVNPFVNVPDGSPISGSPFFTMTDSLQIKTAWNNSNRAEYGSLGRVGYSVKFISFASLTKQKLSSNGSSSWNNSLNMDPESQQDIPFLQH